MGFKKHKANLELSLDNIDQTKMKGKAIKVELDEVVKYNSDPNTVAFDSIMKKVGSADFLNMAKAAVKETLNPKPKVADAPAMVRQLSTQEKVEQAEAAVEVDDHNLEQKKDQVKKVQEKLVADEKERIQAARAKAANRAKIAALAAELKHDQLNAPPGVAIADATGKEAKSEAKEEKSEEKPAAKEDAKEQKPAAKEDAKEQKPAAKEQKVAAKEQKPAAKEQKPAAKEQKPTQEKPAANKKPTDEEKPKLRE